MDRKRSIQHKRVKPKVDSVPDEMIGIEQSIKMEGAVDEDIPLIRVESIKTRDSTFAASGLKMHLDNLRRPRGRPRKVAFSSIAEVKFESGQAAEPGIKMEENDDEQEHAFELPPKKKKTRARLRKSSQSSANTDNTDDPDHIIRYMTRTTRKNKTQRQKALNKLIKDGKLLGTSGIEMADVRRMARQFRIFREAGADIPRSVLKLAFKKIQNEIHAAVSANVTLTKCTAQSRQEAIPSDYMDIEFLGIEIEIVDDNAQTVAWIRNPRYKVIESSDESSQESASDDKDGDGEKEEM